MTRSKSHKPVRAEARIEALRDTIGFDEIVDAYRDPAALLDTRDRFETHQAAVDEVLLFFGMVELALRSGWLPEWPENDESWEFGRESSRRVDITKRLGQGIGGRLSRGAYARISGTLIPGASPAVSADPETMSAFERYVEYQAELLSDPDVLCAMAALRTETTYGSLKASFRSRAEFLRNWLGGGEQAPTLEGVVRLMSVLLELAAFCSMHASESPAFKVGFAEFYTLGWATIRKTELVRLREIAFLVASWTSSEDVIPGSRLRTLEAESIGRLGEFLDKTLSGNLATA